MTQNPQQLLKTLFTAAVDSAQPKLCVPMNLPDAPRGRTVVVGCGKAAAAMAVAVEDHWIANHGLDRLSGVVVTRYGQSLPTRVIKVMESFHPVPDHASVAAAEAILAAVKGLTADDLVIMLASGGGSALMALPADGLSLDDKQRINRELLKSGATIHDMNIVRKHLSRIKGGWLAAAAAPARLVSLLMSDVPGDDPSIIASGPTVADPSTCAMALAILDRHGIAIPPAVRQRLESGAAETPKRVAGELRMIVTPQKALTAAAERLAGTGFKPLILGSSIEGEAREVAIMHAGIARQVIQFGQPIAGPAVLLSGGETTVTVRGKGRGGRNCEFLLALAIALDGQAGVYAMAGDTDGIDGTEDNAGAIITPDTLARAAAMGLNPKDYLANNDGYSFFAALGDLVVTGPTQTNVNDFRAILITN
ncbi:MAG: glycerate kinase [Candidatus Pacebacteria bacterium]|nr:glycerate kinase [Candidatus Paceibacterota bacterium]